jgi:hypothetical protein
MQTFALVVVNRNVGEAAKTDLKLGDRYLSSFSATLSHGKVDEANGCLASFSLANEGLNHHVTLLSLLRLKRIIG